jgi:acetyl esterase
MPELDPAMAAILEEIRRQDLAPLDTLPAAEARAEAERRNAFWNEPELPLARVEEVAAPGPRGDVRVRLYAGERAASSGAAPCVLYVHGGGWVICSLDTHDVVCRGLARAGDFVVASVDYGLAPEHPFPHGLEDCLAALRWLRAEGRGLGIDPGRIALAGDSAGANLSLAMCLALRDAGEPQPRAAGLVYGVFSDDHESPSHAAFGGGEHILSTAAMRWFWDRYVPDPARRRDPLASPLHADLRGLPPLYVSAAELDPLRDDSERLARRLVDAGVDFDYRLWRGVTHACLMMGRSLPAADRFVAEVGGFLARRLAP